MPEAALQPLGGDAAEEVLLDQTYFALEATSFAAFQKMLDKPPAPTDRLRRTLKTRAPWESGR